jgi:peptidoglycan/LPS O-acetylase OafA/YrhL
MNRFRIEPPEPSSGIVLPEIDGLRAVAAMNVLVCHAMLGSAWAPRLVRPLLDGGMGVSLFFVLSGFLLFLPFLRARERGERVPLGPYALRRMLRILPAYYVNLVILLLFQWPEGLTTRSGLATIFAHFTLTFSVSEAMVGSINPVYWSLCVEEQFYLLLPVVARLFAGRRGTLALLLSLPVPTLATFLFRRYCGPLGVALTTTVPFHWTAFALGMLIARAYAGRQLRAPATGSPASAAVSLGFPALAMIGLAMVSVARPFFPREPIYLQIWAIGWALVLTSVLAGPRWLGAPLRWQPVRLLGLMTFSVYLWHMSVAQRVMALSDSPWSFWSALGRVFTVFVFTLPFATGSYLLVERPFMRLRKRLEQRTEPLVPAE